MSNAEKYPEGGFFHKLKWIMFFRVLFTTLLLGSTIIFQLRKSSSFLAEPLLFIYGLTIGIFLLSFIYTLLIRRVKRELPFIMGVMSDLSGDGTDDLPDIADRQFVEIKPDNFDKVLKGMKPRLTYAVDNKLEPDSEDKIGVELKFESFDDFSPERVAEQVDPLRKLMEKRQDLADLKSKLATNRNLNKAIQAALGDDEAKAQLKSELEESEGGEDGGS